MEINCNCLWSRWRARPTVVCMVLTWMMWVWFRDAYGHQTPAYELASNKSQLCGSPAYTHATLEPALGWIHSTGAAAALACRQGSAGAASTRRCLSSARHSAVDQFFPCNNIAFLCVWVLFVSADLLSSGPSKMTPRSMEGKTEMEAQTMLEKEVI